MPNESKAIVSGLLTTLIMLKPAAGFAERIKTVILPAAPLAAAAVAHGARNPAPSLGAGIVAAPATQSLADAKIAAARSAADATPASTKDTVRGVLRLILDEIESRLNEEMRKGDPAVERIKQLPPVLGPARLGKSPLDISDHVRREGRYDITTVVALRKQSALIQTHWAEIKRLTPQQALRLRSIIEFLSGEVAPQAGVAPAAPVLATLISTYQYLEIKPDMTAELSFLRGIGLASWPPEVALAVIGSIDRMMRRAELAAPSDQAILISALESANWDDKLLFLRATGATPTIKAKAAEARARFVGIKASLKGR